MANIIKAIEKSINNGETLVNKQGEFLNSEKVEKAVKKSYVNDLKAGTIPFEKSFTDYKNDILEKEYTQATALLQVVKDTLKYEGAEQEKVETVAD